MGWLRGIMSRSGDTRRVVLECKTDGSALYIGNAFVNLSIEETMELAKVFRQCIEQWDRKKSKEATNGR